MSVLGKSKRGYLMAFNNEIEELKAQIKVLEKKLEELEKTKTPVEGAYKDWWGQYPETGTWDGYDEKRWQGFQAGYYVAYQEKVSETPQERGERVHKEMEETIKIHDGYGVVSSSTKSQTLYGVIAQWYLDSVTDNIDLDVPTCVEDLVDRIELFLPKEQSAEGSQNVYVECTVEGFNDCLNKIKRKLR